MYMDLSLHMQLCKYNILDLCSSLEAFITLRGEKKIKHKGTGHCYWVFMNKICIYNFRKYNIAMQSYMGVNLCIVYCLVRK